MLANPFLDSLKDGDALQNQTFELFQSPQSDVDCGIFDPVVEHWSLAKCDSFRGAVCQFKKGNDNNSLGQLFFLFYLSNAMIWIF